MRRRTRTAIVALVLTTSLGALAGCGGRTDSGNPGNPAGDVTTTLPGTATTTIPSG